MALRWVAAVQMQMRNIILQDKKLWLICENTQYFLLTEFVMIYKIEQYDSEDNFLVRIYLEKSLAFLKDLKFSLKFCAAALTYMSSH